MDLHLIRGALESELALVHVRKYISRRSVKQIKRNTINMQLESSMQRPFLLRSKILSCSTFFSMHVLKTTGKLKKLESKAPGHFL